MVKNFQVEVPGFFTTILAYRTQTLEKVAGATVRKNTAHTHDLQLAQRG